MKTPLKLPDGSELRGEIGKKASLPSHPKRRRSGTASAVNIGGVSESHGDESVAEEEISARESRRQPVSAIQLPSLITAEGGIALEDAIPLGRLADVATIKPSPPAVDPLTLPHDKAKEWLANWSPPVPPRWAEHSPVAQASLMASMTSTVKSGGMSGFMRQSYADDLGEQYVAKHLDLYLQVQEKLSKMAEAVSTAKQGPSNDPVGKSAESMSGKSVGSTKPPSLLDRLFGHPAWGVFDAIGRAFGADDNRPTTRGAQWQKKRSQAAAEMSTASTAGGAGSPPTSPPSLPSPSPPNPPGGSGGNKPPDDPPDDPPKNPPNDGDDDEPRRKRRSRRDDDDNEGHSGGWRDWLRTAGYGRRGILGRVARGASRAADNLAASMSGTRAGRAMQVVGQRIKRFRAGIGGKPFGKSASGFTTKLLSGATGMSGRAAGWAGAGARVAAGGAGRAIATGVAARVAGAGVGASLAGAGAATIAGVPVGLAVAAVAGLMTALVAAGIGLVKFSMSVAESNRSLAKYNGSISAAFASLDNSRVLREQKLGYANERTATNLTKSLDSLEEAMLPLRELGGTALNQIGAQIIDRASDLIIVLNFILTPLRLLARMGEKDQPEFRDPVAERGAAMLGLNPQGLPLPEKVPGAAGRNVEDAAAAAKALWRLFGMDGFLPIPQPIDPNLNQRQQGNALPQGRLR